MNSKLWGVDFSSAPSVRKPIWLACAVHDATGLRLLDLLPVLSLDAFSDWARQPGPWLAGLDLPLGLPRAFVDAQGWGAHLPDVAQQLQQRSRKDWQALIDHWGNARPAGQRLIHRRCDTLLPAGARSTSPLQTRYVPVGLMLHAGLPRLLEAGVTLIGQHAGDPARQCLEAYPGWLAVQVLGRRSYKNADTPDRRAARAELLAALRHDGGGLGVPLHCTPAQATVLLDDPSGDPLDATICALQAAWAQTQPRFAQPADIDPLEGWITGAGPAVRTGKST